MNSSPDTAAQPDTERQEADANHLLAREAGVPFQAVLNGDAGIAPDPIAEWLSLMEVVQMLCPVWPVRDQPMKGDCWRL